MVMGWCRCRCHQIIHYSRCFNKLNTNSLGGRGLPEYLQRFRSSQSVVQILFTRSITNFTHRRLQSATKEHSQDDKDNNDRDEKRKSERKPSSALVKADIFDNLGDKSKDTFLMAIDVFINKDKHARGHVEFIMSALQHMKEFGVHRDLDAYKKLIDVFPKGPFIATNMWQVEFRHYPKQQQCALELLEQMEILGVIPDSELEVMLVNIFGNQAHPLRKLRRMAYWMPKFKNLSPWPIPNPLPEDAFEIAKLAIERITSVDLLSKVTVFYPLEELEDSIDHTWIVSGQSPEQQRLIEEHPRDKPVYVEGAFRIWLRNVCINYFILRAEPKPIIIKRKDEDDVGFLKSIFNEDYKETAIAHIPSVHEQEDGVILGVCATGTSSHDSVLSWIRFLERTNPRLGKDISVLFTFKSPLGPTDDLSSITSTPNDNQFLDSSHQWDSDTKSLSDNIGASSLTEDPLALDVDPKNPDLSKVGIDEKSDTV